MKTLGTVVITKEYDSGLYEFQCTPSQGLTLCLFNDNNVLSFEEIKNLMEFDDNLCEKILKIFCSSKFQILEKVNQDKNNTIKGEYKVNQQFSNARKRIKFKPPSIEVYNAKKIEKIHSTVINSTILKILKSRKQISHENLISELLSIFSNNQPQIKDIKDSIDYLLEDEYIKNDNTDKKTYNYLH